MLFFVKERNAIIFEDYLPIYKKIIKLKKGIIKSRKRVYNICK